MGGSLDKCQVAKFNQDVEKTCSYCKEEEATADHIKRTCKFFHPKRVELDKDLAAIPVQHLPLNIRCGIALAMSLDGRCTYWSKELNSEVDMARRSF